MRIIVPDDDEALDQEAARLERRFARRLRWTRAGLAIVALAGVLGTGAFVAFAQTSRGDATRAHPARAARRGIRRAQAAVIIPPPSPTTRPAPSATVREPPVPNHRPPPARPSASTAPLRPSASAAATPPRRPVDTGLPMPPGNVLPPIPVPTRTLPRADALEAPVKDDLGDLSRLGVPEPITPPGQVTPVLPNPGMGLTPSIPAPAPFITPALPTPGGGPSMGSSSSPFGGR
jgi:hypothetical protein